MTHTIAIVGGTGPEGRGLATRFALAGHRVVIGSRDPERAATAATEIVASLSSLVAAPDITGASNAEAATGADIVVLTVPFEAQRATLEALTGLLPGKIVVDTVVPVRFERGPRPVEVPEGSAAEQAAALLPDSRITAAFHTVAAAELLDIGSPLQEDVLVTGDDADAKQAIMTLVNDIEGLRAVDAGALRYSRFVEGLTVLLIGINVRYKSHAGVRIEGLSL